MPTFNYSFDKLYGAGTTCSIDLVAGSTYTFNITNNTGSAYFVLETVKNSEGVYDNSTPKNLEGTFTNFSNISYHVANDYMAGFVSPISANSFDFTPANNVVKETLLFRGTGGIILGLTTGSSPTTASFQIDTTKVSAGSEGDHKFRLPLTNNGVIDFVIDWGDGNTDTINSYNQPETTHTYSSPGVYEVTITSGVIRGWQFGGSGDRNKLIEIYDWSVWDFNVAGAFRGCNNLISSATSVPTITSTSLNNMFQNTFNFNGPLNGWDVSGVQNFNEVFFGATAFNQPLNSWVVSSATSMNGMFADASAFNQNISSWNVSLVTDMGQMFSGASSFNQPLNSWDVGEVLSMDSMFFAASSFNQPLNSWDVAKVTDMRQMFNIATSFNQPLDAWDVSSVTNMLGMFFGNSMTFNQNIGSWDVSDVTDLKEFLDNALPTSFSPSNLDAIYNGWSALPSLQSNVTASFGVAKYTAAGAAGRNTLVTTYNWLITDGGQV